MSIKCQQLNDVCCICVMSDCDSLRSSNVRYMECGSMVSWGLLRESRGNRIICRVCLLLLCEQKGAHGHACV